MTVTYSEKIMKGDNTPWHFAEVDGVLFECFPYRHEYLVMGAPISVYHSANTWTLYQRIWNENLVVFMKEFTTPDEAFTEGAKMVKAYKKKVAELGRHPIKGEN